MSTAKWLSALVALAALAVGCNGRQQIAMKYQLGVDPALVSTVETRIAVDPADPRSFFADQPFRSVATGVGYTVAREQASGLRVMTVSQEAALGYVFTPQFMFTLLPPVEGEAPPLVIGARALSATRDTLAVAGDQQAGFGAGVELPVVLVDLRCGSAVCTADESCCDKECVRTAETAAHCGGCGQACGPNEGCSGGKCRCAGGSGCAADRACCSDGCQNTMTDPFNCGGCGQRCNTGETCAAGKCHCSTAPGNAACAAGGLCCPGAAPGLGCSMNGKCPCGASMCDTTQLCCSPAGVMMCESYLTDPANCGTCGNACSTPLTCSGGGCKCNGVTCTGGDTCCAGGCANLGNDVANCGMCGKACVMGETCGGGSCKCGGGAACRSDELCCGTSCVKSQMDVNNCGSCGHKCGPQESCGSGNCVCDGGAGCSGNEKCCPGFTGMHGACFDLSNDPNHCGACDKVCGPLESCITGACVQTSCAPDCAMHMNQCTSGMCKCFGGPPCTLQYQCCSTGCKDFKNDRNNCGSCGKVCQGYDLCCNGNCVPNSNSNCGSCGNGCAALTGCCYVNTMYTCRLLTLGCGTAPPPPDMNPGTAGPPDMN